MSAVAGLNHVTLAVRSIPRALAFYRDVLGFTPAAEWPRGAYLSAGDLWLALIEDPERADAPEPGYSHIAFAAAAEDFDALCARLDAAGARTWSENRSEGASRYFLDPDGHKLEIHVGDLQSRLAAMRADPWEGVVFHDGENSS